MMFLLSSRIVFVFALVVFALIAFLGRPSVLAATSQLSCKLGALRKCNAFIRKLSDMQII